MLQISVKLKNKYYDFLTVPNYNPKIVKAYANSMPLCTHIYDNSLSWLGAGISIKSGGFKLVLRPQTLIAI